MREVCFVPHHLESFHGSLRKAIIELKWPTPFTTEGGWNAWSKKIIRNKTSPISWYTKGSWNLKILGDGKNNGCNTYLVLGRPEADYYTQVNVKMAAEVDIAKAMDFLDLNPKQGIFFGSVMPVPTTQKPLNSFDILACADWFWLDDGDIKNIDGSKTLDSNSTFAIDYFSLYKVPNKQFYFIFPNDTMCTHHDSFIGVDDDTKFAVFSNFNGCHNPTLRSLEFSDNVTCIPTQLNPRSIEVEGDTFELDCVDFLKKHYGLLNTPSYTVKSNLMFLRSDDKYKFRMDRDSGYINIKLELGEIDILNSLDYNGFGNYHITVFKS